MTVWDPATGAAVIADAALANAVLTATGAPSFLPTYRYVEPYLASVARLQAMPINTLLTSHYPVYRGDDVATFLAESRAFVDRVEAAVREELAAGAATLRSLCETLSPRLGGWDDSAAPFLAYPLLGHLERLQAYGLVSTERRNGVVAWRWQG